MIAYIDRVLVTDHGASTKSRPKPLANMQVVKDVLYYLWACDEYTFKHSRVRVQISFAILIMAYQGLRPGEFVLSSAHRDKNEGLLYRDITLTAIPLDGRIKWILQVRIRNQKNHRGKESDSVVHILTDQPGNPFLCPVTHYCALALADNAFAKIKSADDLLKIKRKVDIRVKPEMADVPIFLSLTPAGQLSNGKILTVDSLDALLVGLGRRAGYKDSLTAYCFRRGFGNALVDTVTSVQRRQRMGHKSDDTFLYYISNKSGIDTQSIVLGHNQQTEVIDFVRSMAVDVNQSAPVPHGSRLTDAKRRYGGKASSSSNVNDQVVQDDVDESDQEFLTVPKMSTQQHYEVRRRARRLDYRKEQSNFFLTVDEFDDDYGADHDISFAEPHDGLSTVRPGPSQYLRAVLCYEPSRLQLVEMLERQPLLALNFSASDSSVGLTLGDGIAPLFNLAKPALMPVHYPHAEPDKSGCCSFCGRKPLDKKLAMNRHLLDCLLQQEKLNAAAQITTELETLCLPTCLWETCTHSLTTSKGIAVADHITSHMKKACRGTFTCHWNRCQATFDCKTSLSTHLLDVHKLYCVDTLPTNPRFCYECRQIHRSNLAWETHRQEHVNSKLTLFCGQIIRFGVVAVASLCPFCLSADKSATFRTHQFADCFNLHEHLEKHLEGIAWPMICPHPFCSVCIDSKFGFWDHMNLLHGIEPRVQREKRAAARGTRGKRVASRERETDGYSEGAVTPPRKKMCTEASCDDESEPESDMTQESSEEWGSSGNSEIGSPITSEDCFECTGLEPSQGL